MGQTVNLLVFTFGGSNPSLPTTSEAMALWLRASEAVSLQNYDNAEVAQLIEH